MKRERLRNEVSLGQIIRDCRMSICEEYFYRGPQAALAAVADASMTLAPLVAEGELIPTVAWDNLHEVCETLTLREIFGPDAIQHAIEFGPRIYKFFIAAELARQEVVA